MAISLHSIPPASLALHSEGLSLLETPDPGTQRLHVGLLNLMPDKATTERHWLRLLASSSVDAHVSLLRLHSWKPRSTSAQYMEQYYQDWRHVTDLDAIIITGAPLGQFSLQEVRYWPEFRQLLDHFALACTPLLLSCWAAHAALNHYHQLSTWRRKEKLSGVFGHAANRDELTAGMPANVHLPHSRFAQLDADLLTQCRKVQVLLDSAVAGPALLRDHTAPRCYLLGHPEYEADTLALEYERDQQKGMPVAMPANYFINDEPGQLPAPAWQQLGARLLSNWLRPLQAPVQRRQ